MVSERQFISEKGNVPFKDVTRRSSRSVQVHSSLNSQVGNPPTHRLYRFNNRFIGLRSKLGDAAVRLSQSVKYASAGTIEYLVDDATGDFFFLEMNTRLQVEHGITELCYDVDLVELMLRQADAQIAGKGGLDESFLKAFEGRSPKGSAIEVRVYAENPCRNYAPSPGLLQEVGWKRGDNVRVDTWVRTGTRITTFYGIYIRCFMFHLIDIIRSPYCKNNGSHAIQERSHT